MSRDDVRAQFGQSAEDYLTSAVHAKVDDLADVLSQIPSGLASGVDAACGAGHSAFALAGHVGQAVALDLTPEMLGVTLREAAERGISNLTGLLGDALAMPLPDGSQDIVLCRTAAHHFSSVPQFLAECRRVLRPGGWVAVIDTISPEDEGAARALNELEAIRDPSHVWSLSSSAWQAALREAGFEVAFVRDDQHKSIEFQSWVERMRVPAEDRARLEADLRGATGAFLQAVFPEDDPFRFRLPEGRFVARLPA